MIEKINKNEEFKNKLQESIQNKKKYLYYYLKNGI